MSSGIYSIARKKFFSGDIDLINDNIMAALVDLTEYTADLMQDANIGDIPEDSILSEVLLEGRYISDEGAFFADPATFEAVPVSDKVGTGVVLYVNAVSVGESYLISLFDENAASGFPIIATGYDEHITWPVTGILVGEVVWVP